MKYLNVGCGSRFQPSWTNLDFTSTDKAVIQHDLREGIPYPDNEFDLVYSSHVLEHFNEDNGQELLTECHRVTKPGGLIRIAVPNLEEIARNYLLCLSKLKAGDMTQHYNYAWMKLELYDQTIRTESGGSMRKYLENKTIPNLDYVLTRLGMEARNIISPIQSAQLFSQQKTKGKFHILSSIKRLYKIHQIVRERILKMVLGSEYRILQVGRFRDSGEIHLCMYDSYSLKRALTISGFHSVSEFSAIESHHPTWKEFKLDADSDNLAYKPDSIYLEAYK